MSENGGTLSRYPRACGESVAQSGVGRPRRFAGATDLGDRKLQGTPSPATDKTMPTAAGTSPKLSNLPTRERVLRLPRVPATPEARGARPLSYTYTQPRPLLPMTRVLASPLPDRRRRDAH